MGKHKHLRIGAGGMRIPSDEKLAKAGIELSLETQKRIELIRNIRPKQIKIYKEDLDRLAAIGEGNWQIGFYRVLNLSRRCWVTQADLNSLYKIGKGSPRQGLVTAIKLAEESLKDGK